MLVPLVLFKPIKSIYFQMKQIWFCRHIFLPKTLKFSFLSKNIDGYDGFEIRKKKKIKSKEFSVNLRNCEGYYTMRDKGFEEGKFCFLLNI